MHTARNYVAIAPLLSSFAAHLQTSLLLHSFVDGEFGVDDSKDLLGEDMAWS